jgi:putative transposase
MSKERKHFTPEEKVAILRREYYNNVRLNSATGYITPRDVLAERQQEIQVERDRKLETARQQRQSHRQQAA